MRKKEEKKQFTIDCITFEKKDYIEIPGLIAWLKQSCKKAGIQSAIIEDVIGCIENRKRIKTEIVK
jgi:hypothetical protein